MTPAAIQRTLESGVMKQQAAPLSPDERQRIASFLGTAVTLERKREEIANLCPAGAAPGESPAWASWGGGLANTRFQSAKDAGLRAEDVPRLKLKWAFAFPDTSTMRSQPAVYRRPSIRGRAGRQRLRSRHEDRLRVLVDDGAVPGAIGHHGWRGRRQSRAVLRRFRRVRICTGRDVREAVVEGARRTSIRHPP